MNGFKPPLRSLAAALVSSFLLVSLAGCANFKAGSYWIDGGKRDVAYLTFTSNVDRMLLKASEPTLHTDKLLCSIDRYRRAEQLAASQSSCCVEEFYRAAVLSWQVFSKADYRTSDSMGLSVSALDVYHQSLRRLIAEAVEHGRLDGGNGIVIEEMGKRRLIPFCHQGFNWQTSDFQKVVVVGQYGSCSVSDKKTEDGIGIPIVVERTQRAHSSSDDYFLPQFASFPATVFLDDDGNTLRIVNPLVKSHDKVTVAGKTYPLARDNTADIAYGLHFRTDSRLEGFLRPDSPDEKGKLFFSEPFNPEKIPIVFVHGLFSSPSAWGNVYNELRSNPKLYERYQFWFFRYPTGLPFTHSAAELREELNKLLRIHGQDSKNELLYRAVFVGHSMGGLISKLMISDSGNTFWDTIANIPLDQLNANQKVKETLRERLFFKPHPMASRVVFIGTPHRGSAVAGRMLGRLASSSVQQSESQYKRVIQNNPGAFKETIQNGIPTSIDLLDPQEPFLKVIDSLCLNPNVPLHTILGNGCLSLSYGGSDGVVDVSSAKHRGVASELAIATTHNGLLRQENSYRELTRILDLHYQEGNPKQENAWSQMLDWLQSR